MFWRCCGISIDNLDKGPLEEGPLEEDPARRCALLIFIFRKMLYEPGGRFRPGNPARRGCVSFKETAFNGRKRNATRDDVAPQENGARHLCAPDPAGMDCDANHLWETHVRRRVHASQRATWCERLPCTDCRRISCSRTW